MSQATPTIIDTRKVSQMRTAFAGGRHDLIKPLLIDAGVSLGAAIEIAAWLNTRGAADPRGTELLTGLGQRHPILRAAIEFLKTPSGLSRAFAGTFGTAEIRCVSRLDADEKSWWEFLSRFSTACEDAGIHRRYSKALAHAFHEMADNVYQHAVLNGAPLPPAVAAWHVTGGIASFVVLDLGRGVRASLHDNPQWAELDDDAISLRKVVCEQATRKGFNQNGDGYRTVVKNFVDRNGCLSLRSGVGELHASGDMSNSHLRLGRFPHFEGTRVAAWCAPAKPGPVAEPRIS